MGRLSGVTEPLVDVAMKIYRGIWGEDKKVTDTQDRPTVGGTSNRKVADAYAHRRDIVNPEDRPPGYAQVFEMTVTPRNPVTFDQEYVTVDQLQSKFDLDPQETQSLMERFGDGGVDINELGDDPMFIDMMRAREVDLLISPEGVPGMDRTTGDNAMNTGESYRVIDKKIIQNSKRITQYQVDDVGFFSPARRVVEMTDMSKGRKKQWMSLLTEGLDPINSKNGIYPKRDADELKLFEYLDSFGPETEIRREEVLKYIDDNRIQLSERVYVGESGDPEEPDITWTDVEVERDAYMSDRLMIAEENIRDEFPEWTYMQNEFRDWLDENNRTYMVEADMVESELDDLKSGMNPRYEVADLDSEGRGTFIYDTNDFDDWVDERARFEYEEDPHVYTTNDEGYLIVGNDEWGYRIEDPTGQRIAEDIRRLHEAISTANLHSIENGYAEYRHTEGTINPDWFPSFTMTDQANERGTNPKNILMVWDNPSKGSEFEHGHFRGVPNYFAHSRTEERLVDGKRSLHIDEIQSDWHTLGRDSGMFPASRVDQTRLFYGDSSRTIDGQSGPWFLRDSRRPDKTPRIFESEKDLLDFVEKFRESNLEKARPVGPDGNYSDKFIEENVITDDATIRRVKDVISDPASYAPMEKNWREMMFKRTLAEALDDPAIERVTWTTARTQRERYEFMSERGSHYFSEVNVRWIDKDTVRYDFFDIAGNKKVIQLDNISQVGLPNAIKDYVAKKMDKSLLAFNGKQYAEIVNAQKNAMSIYPQELNFKDVETIPAPGFTLTYDQTLPKWANKLIKRYGAKVGKTRIEGATSEIREQNGQWSVRYTKRNGESQEITLPSEAAAKWWMEKREKNIEVWYFDITPEMRQDFMENGMPLTQNGDDDDNEQERMVA